MNADAESDGESDNSAADAKRLKVERTSEIHWSQISHLHLASVDHITTSCLLTRTSPNASFGGEWLLNKFPFSTNRSAAAALPARPTLCE